ncbi:hypothetical protein QBZ16_001265 [Prototheca wickerhamii]|uniref:Uncharacterized protein n=1 Tax=Prototheca wickerhamii TaxID=3111 RepID=A0AAD9MG23_PROWI|nr:hypothetical protein QBZ16_001265 [Prototheca wickerhamii]
MQKLCRPIVLAARHVPKASSNAQQRQRQLKEEHIKDRLSNVPVFAVVNDKDEFVVISSESEATRQMGLVFFDKSDAQSLAESMKHSGSKVAKRVRVIPTSLSSVYNMAVAPAEAPGQPVFRFVPQPEQVEAALKLYQHAGVNAAGFMGVPLFQAEGLTVISEGKRKTPLFFSKRDLDAALGGAASDQQVEMQDRARKLADEAATAVERCRADLLNAGTDRRVRKAAQKELDAALALQKKYTGHLSKMDAAKAS